MLGAPFDVNAAAEGVVEGIAVTFWKPEGPLEAVLETVFAYAPRGDAVCDETFVTAVGTITYP